MLDGSELPKAPHENMILTISTPYFVQLNFTTLAPRPNETLILLKKRIALASAKYRDAPSEMHVFRAPKGCPGRPSWSPRWAPRAGGSDKSASASASGQHNQIYVTSWYRNLWNLPNQTHHPRDLTCYSCKCMLCKQRAHTACGTAWLALAQRVLGHWHTYLPWLGGLTGLHVTRLQYTASQLLSSSPRSI